MSAGGSSTFVWIKLATAPEDEFAYLEIDGTLVGKVIALACNSFAWGLTANKLRIHLVAAPGSTSVVPTSVAIDAALAQEPLPVNAAVDSGTWLVAVPTTTTPAGGSGGGGWGVEVARSSISPRSVKSLESAHSLSREAEASVAFWTLTHTAFPGAALEQVQSKPLDGSRPISNRTFLGQGTSQPLGLDGLPLRLQP